MRITIKYGLNLFIMKAIVKNVSRIAKDKNGQPLNLTVIRLTNGKSIIRTLSQIVLVGLEVSM
jgi:hypothetical protein